MDEPRFDPLDYVSVLRRRKSTFIHGIEDDARDVIDHLGAYLATAGRSMPRQCAPRRFPNAINSTAGRPTVYGNCCGGECTATTANSGPCAR